jgi:hypothetical protein
MPVDRPLDCARELDAARASSMRATNEWTAAFARRTMLAVNPSSPILVVEHPIGRSALARLLGRPFDDMIKFVVDVEKGIVALGGELHADAEAVLIERGSRQAAPWGGNYFPGAGEAHCIEYTSLINIRPTVQNRTLSIESETVRDRVKEIIFALVGRGEALS